MLRRRVGRVSKYFPNMISVRPILSRGRGDAGELIFLSRWRSLRDDEVIASTATIAVARCLTEYRGVAVFVVFYVRSFSKRLGSERGRLVGFANVPDIVLHGRTAGDVASFIPSFGEVFTVPKRIRSACVASRLKQRGYVVRVRRSLRYSTNTSLSFRIVAEESMHN